MTHNLDLGPDAGANHLLALLRGLSFSGPVASDSPLLPGLFFSLDPESSTQLRCHSAPGMMVEAEFTVARPGRWMALHINLSEADLRGRQVLGVVCKSHSPAATTFRLCLRSGREGGFTDTFFRKTVVAYAETSTHLDALMLDAEPGLPTEAPWRELVLFFRPETSKITLQDLRIFIV